MRIAIDGPCAAGKTTTAKRIAEELGIVYVDTGAMFRAIALYCQMSGITADDVPKRMEDISSAVSATIHDGKVILFIDGYSGSAEELEAAIRTSEIAQSASLLSQQQCIRDAVLRMEQAICVSCDDIIMEGRDIGTVVMTNADVKFYLDANVLIRAYRRQLDLSAKGGHGVQPEEVLSQLVKRDKQDMERPIAPLKRAPDATYVDNTRMSFEETVERLEANIKLAIHNQDGENYE